MEAVAAGSEPWSRFEVLLRRSKACHHLPCTPILIEAVVTQVGSGSRLNESAKLSGATSPWTKREYSE